MIAENLLLKQQLIIHSRSRQRAPVPGEFVDQAATDSWNNPRQVITNLFGRLEAFMPDIGAVTGAGIVAAFR